MNLPEPPIDKEIRYLDKDRLVIMGVKVSLSQKDVPYAVQAAKPNSTHRILPSQKDLEVHADSITITGKLFNPCRSIRLVARTIICEDGSELNTDGADPVDFSPGDLPKQKETPGANGQPGKTGTSGTTAGSVGIYAHSLQAATRNQSAPILVLSAKGGRGGRGQDGHDGMRGTDGTGPWGRGGTGGTGGSAGMGGPGGTGGTISVGITEHVDANRIHTDVAGGPSGPAGKPGAGGRGGHGSRDVNRKPGPEGWTGPMGLQSRRNVAGRPGKVVFANGAEKFPTEKLGQLLTLGQLKLIQHSANLNFLNRKYSLAAAEYKFLTDATRQFKLADGNAGAKIDSKIPVSKQDAAARAAIFDGSLLEMMRLRQGLDFYGHARDWVPVMTLQGLRDHIDRLLALDQIMLDALDALDRKENSLGQKNAAIRQIKHNVEKDIGSIEADTHSMRESISQQEKFLNELLEDIYVQRVKIAAEQAELNRQYEEDNGCSLEHALNIATNIAEIGAAVYTGYGEITEAATAFREAEKTIDALKNGIKFAKAVKSEIEPLRKGYDLIKGFIDEDHPDGGKLVVDEEKYDAMLDKYISKYAIAKKLKRTVHHYFELIRTRNKAVINYNALYLQQARLEAELKEKAAAYEDIAAKIAQGHDPALYQCIAFLRAAEAQNRLYIMKRIYEENRAFEYWSLKDNTIATSDLSLGFMTTTHAVLVQELENWASFRGRPFERFEGLKVTVHREDLAVAFAQMEKTKRLAVAVEWDHPSFANKTHVTVDAVSVSLPDYESKNAGRLQVNVVHSGVGRMQTQDGNIKSFTHAPRPTLYEYDYGEKRATTLGTIGDQAQGYTGLSPFTVWSLNFGLRGNEFLDLTKIASVQLSFDGHCLGPGID